MVVKVCHGHRQSKPPSPRLPHRRGSEIRHPIAPRPTVTGPRLVVTTLSGFPCCARSPPCTCHRHYPGTATGCAFRSLPQPFLPSPHGLTGRPVHRPFRGLLSVHSRYGLHTRQVTKCDPLHQRLQPLRCLHDCSDCFRPER